MVRLLLVGLIGVLFLTPVSRISAESVSAGQARVLRGIPHIAKVVAPLYNVKWEEFAQSLAGICAVESTCSPTYQHPLKGGGWSQYQGLYQMNDSEVRKAEADLARMMPQIQQLAQSGQIPADSYKNFQDAVRAGQSMGSEDRRFHPEYGVIIGAVKHVQIHRQLSEHYPGKPVHQAAGHMTAQFSGSVQEKIRANRFTATISGAEARALALNRVIGGQSVETAIDSAGTAWGDRMQKMMNTMAAVTNNMTLAATAIEAFHAPAYRSGDVGTYSGMSFSPVSELLENGFIKPNDPLVQENFPNANQGATSVSPTQSGSPGDSQSSTSGAIGPSASTLVMQATSALPGATVLVAWSSVGMQSKSCSLGVKDSTSFIQGENEGSQRFELPSSASSGSTLVLELKCTSSTGQSVVKGTSITIE